MRTSNQFETIQRAGLVLFGLAAFLGFSASVAGGPDRRGGGALVSLQRDVRPAPGGVGSLLAQDDHDNDGVLDWADNCPYVANPEGQKLDTDRDGLGDACDAFPGGGPLTFVQEVQLPRPDAAFDFDHFPLRLATAPGGRIFVLIGTSTTGGVPRNLWLISSTDNGATWSTPVKVNSNDNVFWYTMADMAVDDAGRVFVTYDRENGQITLARSTNNGTSFTWTTIVGPGGSAGYSAVAAFNNRVYVAWDTAYVCSAARIRQRRSSDGGATFGTAAEIKGAGSCYPELAISTSDEKVRLAYADVGVTGYVSVATSTNYGASYGTSVQVRDGAAGSGVSIILPALITEGAAGYLHTGWVENDIDASGVFSYSDYIVDRSTNGGTSYGTDLNLTRNLDHPDSTLMPGGDQWDLTADTSGHVRRLVRDGTVYGRHTHIAVSTDNGASFTEHQPVKPPVPDFYNRIASVDIGADGETLVAFERIQASEITASRYYFVRTNWDTSLRATGGTKTDFYFDPKPGATGYDVTRGLVSVARAAGHLGGSQDFLCNWSSAHFTDTGSPAAGDSFYYLVRIRTASGPGSWGSISRDAVIPACP